MFGGNNNLQKGGPFGGWQQQQTGGPFGGNTQQNANPFGNNNTQQGGAIALGNGPVGNTQGNNAFGQQANNANPFAGNNNTQQQQQGATVGGGMFNNAQQQQQGTGMFGGGTGTGMFGGGNNANTGGATTGNMFGGGTGGNTGATGGIFGGNTGGNTGGTGGIFGGNTGANTGGMFGGNTGANIGGMFGGNTGGTMFGANNTNTANRPTFGQNPTTGATSTTGGNTMFGGGNTMNNNTQQQQQQPIANLDALAYHNHLESIKNQLTVLLNSISSLNYEALRVDSKNCFKDQPINKLPIKNECLKITSNFAEYKKYLEEFKRKNQEIQKKSQQHSDNIRKKLTLYKQCLQQTIAHQKLVKEIEDDLNLMDGELQSYFKPLYNAYKSKRSVSMKEPNDFDLKMSYEILTKFERLNQQIDDLVACEGEQGETNVDSTITVYEQLVQYYENISCSFREFQRVYDSIKREAIERSRKGNYEGVMNRVKERTSEKLKSDYKYYALVKEIDEVLAKKEAREQTRRQDDIGKGNYYGSSKY